MAPAPSIMDRERAELWPQYYGQGGKSPAGLHLHQGNRYCMLTTGKRPPTYDGHYIHP